MNRRDTAPFTHPWEEQLVGEVSKVTVGADCYDFPRRLLDAHLQAGHQFGEVLRSAEVGHFQMVQDVAPRFPSDSLSKIGFDEFIIDNTQFL